MIKLGISDFFKDIGNFLSFKDVLGIDIGTVSMKLLEVARKGERLEVKNYGILETKEYLERPNAALQTSSLKLSDRDAAPLLETLLNEIQPSTRTVIASIPSFGVFTAPLDVPLLSPEETERLISFQARQYIPLPINEVDLEWTKVDEFETKTGARFQRVVLTAIPHLLTQTYRSLFKRVGLKLVALEVEIQALVRALFVPTDPTTILLDIGGESTSIAVVHGGVLKHMGQMDYGGAALTQAVARSLGVSSWRAEELKRRRGLLGEGREYELSTSLTPFLDVIIQEVERVRAAYERGSSHAVERIMVVGGGAALPGITEYIEHQTSLIAENPYPFRHLSYPSALEPAMKTLQSEFAATIGLVLKLHSADEK